MPILQSDAVVKKKNNGAESKQLQRSLSGLPDDVLRLILKRLNWVDRVPSCLVSYNFSGLLQEIPCQPADKLPWLFHTSFGLTWDGRFLSRCDLCPPFSERTYSVTIMDQEARRYLRYAKPFASSSGWVLLLRHIDWEDHNSYYFSLYRPYNNRFVKLPKLEDCLPFGRATIFVNKSSSVSVFYARLDWERCTIILSMCQVGATKWKNFKFRLPVECIELKATPLYSDGYVYCFLDHGSKVVIFDVVFQDWKFLSCDFPYGFNDNGGPFECYFYFNGELVKCAWTGARSARSYSWRLDKSLKKWVQQESLGDLTLFLAHYASVFPVPAVGELRSYANTVCNFAAGELYPASDYSWYWVDDYCWIEPPLLART